MMLDGSFALRRSITVQTLHLTRRASASSCGSFRCVVFPRGLQTHWKTLGKSHEMSSKSIQVYLRLGVFLGCPLQPKQHSLSSLQLGGSRRPCKRTRSGLPVALLVSKNAVRQTRGLFEMPLGTLNTCQGQLTKIRASLVLRFFSYFVTFS